MKYAIKDYDEEKMAKARVYNAKVSFKVAIEVCNMLRNKPLNKAKNMLQDVLGMKKAVPYKRFNMDVGHKRKIGPGRYPQKASEIILSLLKVVEANAANKGLGNDLFITHLVPNKGTNQWHFGRQRRRKMKASHIEIVVKENEKSTKNKMVQTKNEEKKLKNEPKKIIAENKEPVKKEPPKKPAESKESEKKPAELKESEKKPAELKEPPKKPAESKESEKKPAELKEPPKKPVQKESKSKEETKQ